MNALEFRSGLLYGADANENLYTISTTTGLTSTVGAMHFAAAGDVAVDRAGKMYLSAAAPDDLVLLNPLTGAGTAIGPLGFSNVYGLAFDTVSQEMFGYSATTNQILRIDTTTGAGTAISTLSLTGTQLYGIAFAPVTVTVPESTTPLLALSGMIVLGIQIVCKQKRKSDRWRLSAVRSG